MKPAVETEAVRRLLLTPEQAAQALGIGRSFVYELLRSGQLESVRIGTCRRVPEAALHDFVEQLRSIEPEAAGVRGR